VRPRPDGMDAKASASAARVRDGSITPSTTPDVHRPADSAGDALVSAASAACRASRSPGCAAASFLRCRMPRRPRRPSRRPRRPARRTRCSTPASGRSLRCRRRRVSLAGHQRHPRHDRLAERVQQLGAAAHDAVPLLTRLRAGNPARLPIHQTARRNASHIRTKRAALLGRRRVEAAAQTQWVVRDDSHRAAGQPAQPGHDVGCPLRVQFDERALVQGALDEGVDVVGALRVVRQAAPRGSRSGPTARRSNVPGRAKQAGVDDPSGVQSRVVGVGGDVDDAAAPSVRVPAPPRDSMSTFSPV